MRNILLVLVATAVSLLPFDAAALPQYAKRAVVARDGTGDYPGPIEAMAALATWCGTPTATNPCLIKIMPGEYNLGGGAFDMKAYVDVEGSGMGITILKGTNAGYGVVRFYYDATSQLRSLSVDNPGGVQNAIGVWCGANSSPRLADVRVTASGGSSSTWAVYVITSGKVELDRVVASAFGGGGDTSAIRFESGYGELVVTGGSFMASGGLNAYAVATYGAATGIGALSAASARLRCTEIKGSLGSLNNVGVFNQGATLTLSNVSISTEGPTGSNVSQAVSNVRWTSHYGEEGTVRIDGSVLRSIGGSPYAIAAYSPTYVGYTRAEAPLAGGVGRFRCIGVYDANYQAVACPP
jgi:hypothetical protein